MLATTIKFNGTVYNRYFIDAHMVEITPCFKWGRTDGFMVAVNSADHSESKGYVVHITDEIMKSGKKQWGKTSQYEIGIKLNHVSDDTYELEYSEEGIRQGGCLLW
ncbi:MAG: hypothetical protein NC548_37260 [Lachnospiraceae bacterium]|nr:hypothetical protein [Lachnospiraceae bacterium]